MRYEEIGDPIEVITLFREGKMRPLKFRWKNDVFRIDRINGGWISDEGYNRRRHYAVCANESPDVYELSYSIETMNWELTRVCLVG